MLKHEPPPRGVLQDAVSRPSPGFSPGPFPTSPARPAHPLDAGGLALVILAVAVGAALVLMAAAVFIQTLH
jgi:hypothetical protein